MVNSKQHHSVKGELKRLYAQAIHNREFLI
jgi:hypothetical protein